jgi:hypothetical protein
MRPAMAIRTTTGGLPRPPCTSTTVPRRRVGPSAACRRRVGEAATRHADRCPGAAVADGYVRTAAAGRPEECECCGGSGRASVSPPAKVDAPPPLLRANARAG